MIAPGATGVIGVQSFAARASPGKLTPSATITEAVASASAEVPSIRLALRRDLTCTNFRPPLSEEACVDARSRAEFCRATLFATLLVNAKRVILRTPVACGLCRCTIQAFRTLIIVIFVIFVGWVGATWIGAVRAVQMQAPARNPPCNQSFFCNQSFITLCLWARRGSSASNPAFALNSSWSDNKSPESSH